MSSLARMAAFAPLFLMLFLLQEPVRLPVLDAVQIWAYGDRHSYSCPVDTLLVMGAAQYDGTPSPVFKRRLDLAFRLYQDGCADRIVVSGGSRPGDRYSEGEAGVAYLAGLGVPESVLLAETRAESTFQNIRNSLPLLDGEQVLLVTDDLHAFRSQWLAEKLGLRAEVATVATVGRRLAYGGRELVGVLAHQAGYLR